MRLFHFSENGEIEQFIPRPVLQPAPRAPGWEWLNEPLVWAIAEEKQYLYLFPRDCPRIVLWPTEKTNTDDRDKWFGDVPDNTVAVAYIEDRWLDSVERATVFRYDMPEDTFLDLKDAGMHVSRSMVIPSGVTKITNLRAALSACHAQLKAVPSLAPFRPAWESTLHVSGIRLRNAAGWQ